MALSDLPGYVQGFIFADNSAYYDSVAKRFLDQSPYAAWSNNHLDITVGTPSFGTIGTGQGMVLDNTVQGQFIAPALWEGSVIAVMKPNMTTNTSTWPLIFGWAASVASANKIGITRASSSDYRHNITLGGATSLANVSLATQDPQVTAFSFNQQNRRVYGTKDGSTIVTGGAVADAGAGISGFGNGIPQGLSGLYARFGNISGTIGDTSLSVNPMVFGELHFFRADLLNNHAAQLQTEIAALKTKYGL